MYLLLYFSSELIAYIYYNIIRYIFILSLLITCFRTPAYHFVCLFAWRLSVCYSTLWLGLLCLFCILLVSVGGCVLEVKNGGPKIVKNGPRVWAFCKIEFSGIQKPVQILTQKMGFFRNPGNRGVGVICLVVVGVLVGWLL